MKTIYILGSINTDLVIQAPDFPKPGETLVGNGFFMAQGGKGANQAVAASRLGGKVKMCGAVGNDDFGKNSLASLAKEKMDLQHVKTVEGPSGLALITIAHQDNSIVLEKGANDKITKSDVDEFLKDAEEGDLFLTQLEIPLDVVGYALMSAKKKKMMTVLNPAPMNVEIIPYLKYVDIITPNETETERFGGVEKLSKDVDVIVQTLGGKGYQMIQKGNAKTYPCLKVDVVDTTSAGDTLCGGLVSALSRGHSLEEAARFGSFAASLACTKLGAQPSIPTFEEVSQYLTKK